jgi:hypothetical protein
MAELDRQYAEQIAWLIQWRQRCDELIESGQVSPKEFVKVEAEVLDEIRRLRDLRRHRIAERLEAKRD